MAVAAYGNADEVRVGAKRLLRIGKESGGTYLGDEISQGDWASRHDRYATPLHGRLQWLYTTAPMQRFGGGTNEIQRAIIAQRGLGLPRK